MEPSLFERALHDRTRLALSAAVVGGLPGQFVVIDQDGLLGALTTASDLAFLNSVSGITDESVEALPALLSVFASVGAPAPGLRILEPSVTVTEKAQKLGYVLTGIAPVAAIRLPAPFRPGLRSHGAVPSTIRVTEAEADAEDRECFLATLAKGYAAPAAVNAFIAAEHRADGLRRFVAWRNDHPVGAAAFSSHEGTVVLGGAATIPAARRTGVQTALLRHRLDRATDADHTVAVATAGPDTPSARNLARAGFTILARQNWDRPQAAAMRMAGAARKEFYDSDALGAESLERSRGLPPPGASRGSGETSCWPGRCSPSPSG